MRRTNLKVIIIFLGLTVVTGAMLVAAQGLSDAYERGVLISMGSAIFGAGLAVFMLRLLATTNVAEQRE